jgi:hypothetical protein
MATASGTSVIGLQTLITDTTPAVLTSMALIINPATSPATPQKLGELYLQAKFALNGWTGWLNIERWLIMQDGIYQPFYIENSTGSTILYKIAANETYRLVANWRMPGLSWYLNWSG